jgi:MoaA/NifB/PqqE/SkfB family radical SAM enzyme
MNLNNTKQFLKRLDVNVAYACNIQCRGCISLSDFDRRGVVTNQEINSWLEYWSTGLDIETITLFGGEPLINPELIEICKTIRKHYPAATIRLITNGYLLTNFDPGVWFEFEPFEIQVSIHRLDHVAHINQQLQKILSVKSGWKTSLDNLNAHQQILFELPGFKIYKSKFKDFVAPYQLVNQQLQPFRSDPVQAHKICGSPNTPVLYKGKLYKCPPVANIIDITNENWNNYHTCSDLTMLSNFVSQVGIPESVCSQCPENPAQHSYDHFDPVNVYVKQKNIS